VMQQHWPAANQIVSYNAGAVKNYITTSNLVCFEKKDSCTL
jgi:hypothetical protein